MSVYVQGFNIPEIEGNRRIKAEIRQLDGNLEFGIMTGGYKCCEQWTYYPLVKVQNHGRLIDADALLESIKGTQRYFDLKFDIESAPTVIPADNTP